MEGNAGRSDGHMRPQNLAEKMLRLIEMRTPRGNKRLSYEQVARSINEAEGRNVISGPYVWELATGRTTNPRIHHLDVLARWAGTEIRYFFDDDYARRVEPQLALLSQLKEGGVLNVALRARDLSDSSREQLGMIIDHLRSLEGINETEKDE